MSRFTVFFERPAIGVLRQCDVEGDARLLFQAVCRRQGVEKDQLVIHADRGSPVIAVTVAELMSELKVAKSQTSGSS